MISKSGVLSLSQNAQGSFQSTYYPSQDYFKLTLGGFGVNCNGRIICGAGWDNSYNHLKNVFEFHNNNFIEIKPLLTGRCFCSSLYIPPALEHHVGLMLVAGSSVGEGRNTMEYLMINNDFRSNHWSVCDDNLPCSFVAHQMNLLQNKLIITGGLMDNEFFYISPFNNAWQGVISFNKKLQVNWSPLPPMMENRQHHVAVVIQDKLFCIGGDGSKSSEYFSFETNRWKKGPELPFMLAEAKSVLTKQQNQCFLLGGKRDGERSANISLFDPINGLTNIEGTLNIGISCHVAVLI